MTALSDTSIAFWCNPAPDRYELPLVEPYDPTHLQPCSYDLSVDADLDLDPLEFKLLSTIEKVNIPYHIQGQIYGRSSIGRLGVFIHISAGFIDAGFRGNLTLECFNASKEPFYVPYGTRVAQIGFYLLDQPARSPYRGRYQNQKGVTPSKL